MKLLLPFAILIAILLLTFVADDPAREADLVLVNQNEVFTLDPQRMSYMQDLRLAYALYEGLVRWDNHDFSIHPAAAALPVISADRLTYTFSLKPEARWSNGDQVSAHDFKYAWRRAILPDTAADYSALFFCIEGAEEFFHWRSKLTADFAAIIPVDAPVNPAKIHAVADRLERLLNATDLPTAIAPPPRRDRGSTRHAITRLRTVADSDSGTHGTGVLDDEPELRNWLDALDAPSSREAEARWMWRETMRRFDQTVGLRAVDDHTLVIQLARPTAYFLDLVCFGVFYPVYRPSVEGWPDDWREVAGTAERPDTSARTIGWHEVPPPPFADRRFVNISSTTGKFEQRHGWARPNRLIGNGPYILDEWRYKRDLRLKQNQNYHNPALVKSETVLILTIEDTNTSVLAFETGRVDWLSDIGAEYQIDMLAERRAYERHNQAQLDKLRNDGLSIDDALAQLSGPTSGERRNIRAFPTFGTDFYSFNCRPTLSDGRQNPFADARVRRAFVMAVNKHEIVAGVTRLNEPVMTALIPPDSIPDYTSPDGLPYDVARARTELADAGWMDRNADGIIENESGERFPVIDLLWTTNTPRYKWISLNLKSQWERELGVRIELRGVESKFYKEDLKQGKFMIARGRWYGDYGDPTTFLDINRTGDGNNDRGYSNPRFDELLDQAAREPDTAARMAILQESERFLMQEELPLLTICQLVQVYMYEPGRLQGLSTHPRLTQYLWQMKVDKSQDRSRP